MKDVALILLMVGFLGGFATGGYTVIILDKVYYNCVVKGEDNAG